MDSWVLKQTNKKFLWEQLILGEFYTYAFKILKEYARLWRFKTLRVTLPSWNDCCTPRSAQTRTVPRNDGGVLGRKRIMSKCKCVRSYWRKASGVKGVKQRLFWRQWTTQAGTNLKEAEKASLFWRHSKFWDLHVSSFQFFL